MLFSLIGDHQSRFNHHLGKKGISGNIRVSYEDKTLSIEVTGAILLQFACDISILLL